MNYDKLVKNIATILELGGIAALTYLGIKAENERHKTACKLIDTEFQLGSEKLSGVLKDIKIDILEKELEELKAKSEKES